MQSSNDGDRGQQHGLYAFFRAWMGESGARGGATRQAGQIAQMKKKTKLEKEESGRHAR